jgi:hypothetical protein
MQNIGEKSCCSVNLKQKTNNFLDTQNIRHIRTLTQKKNALLSKRYLGFGA